VRTRASNGRALNRAVSPEKVDEAIANESFIDAVLLRVRVRVVEGVIRDRIPRLMEDVVEEDRITGGGGVAWVVVAASAGEETAEVRRQSTDRTSVVLHGNTRPP
jgi:hypothetical protein